MATQDWADDDDDLTPSLPPPQVTQNADGTETHLQWSIREDGKRVKTTRVIRKTVRQLRVPKGIAERKKWPKFGQEKGKPPGPQSDTTSVGENIDFRPMQGFKPGGATKGQDKTQQLDKDKLKNISIKCRICSGEHFTSKCPFKDTMAPEGDPAGMSPGLADDGGAQGGGMSTGPGGSYVPPHLRKGGAATGERMGGRFERDDLATLRVTNVSEFAEEQDLRDMFERYGRVTRVFLAKDRETGRAKGFAFVSYQDRTDAAKACEKMDGYGFGHLILRVEFAKKATT